MALSASAQTPTYDFDVRTHISLGGKVVDEHDRPLAGVRMTIIESRFDAETFGTSYTRRNEIVDGWFSAQCTDCADLRLRFSKEGYYPQRVGMEATDEELAEFLLDPERLAAGYERSDLIVRLARPKQPVVLERREGFLGFGPEGIERVLAFGTRYREGVPYEFLMEKHAAATGKGGGPPLFITLSWGESPVKSFFADDASETLRAAIAAPVVLDLEPANGGVIPFQPTETHSNLAFREITTAPEHGYQKRLEIPPGVQGKLYFYCKIDGLYGKGRVSPPWIRYGPRDLTYVTTHVEIRLNPDGTRNLEELY